MWNTKKPATSDSSLDPKFDVGLLVSAVGGMLVGVGYFAGIYIATPSKSKLCSGVYFPSKLDFPTLHFFNFVLQFI